jgi:molybdate transport system permease protein
VKLPSLIAAPVLIAALYAAAGALGLVGPDAHGFTIAHVTRVLGAGSTWRGVGWSLATAIGATVAATIASIALAIAFRGTSAGDRAARALAAVPLPMPLIVAATVGVLVFGQRGLVLDRFGLGFMATMAWKAVPFLTVVATSILATRGAQLEEVARTLGATRGDVVRRITVPVLWRGLAPASIAVAIVIAGSFEGAYLLAPSRPLALPVLTYAARRADAYVLVLVGLVLGAIGVATLEWARARWDPQ